MRTSNPRHASSFPRRVRPIRKGLPGTDGLRRNAPSPSVGLQILACKKLSSSQRYVNDSIAECLCHPRRQCLGQQQDCPAAHGSGQAQQQRRFSILCPGATEMVGAPPRCGGGAFAILRKSRVADPCERRHTRKRNGGRRWSMRIRSGYMSSGPTKIEGLGNRSNLAITAKARLPDPEGNRGR